MHWSTFSSLLEPWARKTFLFSFNSITILHPLAESFTAPICQKIFNEQKAMVILLKQKDKQRAKKPVYSSFCHIWRDKKFCRSIVAGKALELGENTRNLPKHQVNEANFYYFACLKWVTQALSIKAPTFEPCAKGLLNIFTCCHHVELISILLHRNGPCHMGLLHCQKLG